MIVFFSPWLCDDVTSTTVRPAGHDAQTHPGWTAGNAHRARLPRVVAGCYGDWRQSPGRPRSCTIPGGISPSDRPDAIAACVVHVLVSHYAVGRRPVPGRGTAHAYRTATGDYLDYLRRHARFFVLLTVVFGAITGVGIWWTSGWPRRWPPRYSSARSSSAGPPSTASSSSRSSRPSSSTTTGAGCRREPLDHLWIYGLAAWISLVLITGITALCWTRAVGRGTINFWSGLLQSADPPADRVPDRRGAVAQLALCLLARGDDAQHGELHKLIESRSTRPALLGAVMVTGGAAAGIGSCPTRPGRSCMRPAS